ncbi:MAG: hypothetical protein K0S09_1578 [Sphingobacteriaceae bacterium]|jgi:hypothetical protein|nr:hypothetical protein [Sphingobacteriaceae bacterium]
MKKALFLIALTLFTSFHGIAQKPNRGYIRKTAIADAKQFTLSKADSLQFKKEHRHYRSDLLKPTNLTTSDPLLLQDSLYNDVFRSVAFANNTKNRTSTSVIIGCIGILAVIVVIVAVGARTARGAFDGIAESII